jgi:hypothetical protein
MGIELDAVRYVAELLQRLLFELLEQSPKSAEDLVAKVRAICPAALANFSGKHATDSPKFTPIKGRFASFGGQSSSKSKEAKSLAAFQQKMHTACKEHLGYKLDDKAMQALVAVFEYILYDVLNWAGTYVTKLLEENTTITLTSLRSALNADRVSY